MPLLNPVDPFPRLTIGTGDGQTLTLPEAFAGDHSSQATQRRYQSESARTVVVKPIPTCRA
jgi:hypothetical protein